MSTIAFCPSRICPALAAMIAAAVCSSVGAIVVPLEHRDGWRTAWPRESFGARFPHVYTAYLDAERGGTSTRALPPPLSAPTLERPDLIILVGELEEPLASSPPLFTYDFPGNPGSGLAADQTNPQPANASFSDFTRTGVSFNNSTGNFGSAGWAQTSTIDLSEFNSFSITTAGGFDLTLTHLTFDAFRSSTGPASGQISLFLNGSTTPYATFSYSPTTTNSNYLFDFPDITAEQGIDTVSFNFYGWNAANNGGTLAFDNVTTFGAVTPVPELNPTVCAVGACLLTAGAIMLKRRRSKSQRNNA